MQEQGRSPDKTTIACGLLTVGLGLFIGLSAFGIIPGGKAAGSERWVGLIVGLAFACGGIAVTLQTATGATPGGAGASEPPGTPKWVRPTLTLLSLAIVASLAAIASWVAFGPGTRAFSGPIPFLPGWLNESLGRAVFGFGAILAWIMLIVMAVTEMRRSRARNE
jgi:hypothetical protein